MSKLTSRDWWKAALLRALYTAIAIGIPYIGAVRFADVPWLMAASAAAVGAVLSLATSLFGLPESEGVNLPWWLAALERTAKTFGQSLAGGLAGATFLHEVDWLLVLQAAALAAFISLLRLVLATLPADPTAPTVVLEQNAAGTWRAEPSSSSGIPGAVDVGQVADLSSERRYPLG